MSVIPTSDTTVADHVKKAVELQTEPFNQRMNHLFLSIQVNSLRGRFFLAERLRELHHELRKYQKERLRLIQNETKQIFEAIEKEIPEKITADGGLTDEQIAEQKKLLTQYVSQTLMHFEEFQHNAIKHTEDDIQRHILVCTAKGHSLQHVMVSFSPLSVPYVGPNNVLPEKYRILVDQATFTIDGAHELITKQFKDDADANQIKENGLGEIEEHCSKFSGEMSREYIDGLNRIMENINCQFIVRFEWLNDIEENTPKRECLVRQAVVKTPATETPAADQRHVGETIGSSSSVTVNREEVDLLGESHEPRSAEVTPPPQPPPDTTMDTDGVSTDTATITTEIS